MTLRLKAVAAALIVSLVPVAASAQSVGHYGPGSYPVIGAPVINPGFGAGDQIVPVQDHGCGAAYAQILVGRSIHNTPLPGGARVIGPGTIVTYDYRTDRLNIAHDGYGTITRVYCG